MITPGSKQPIMSFKDFMYTIQHPGQTPPGAAAQAPRPGYQPGTPRRYAQAGPNGPTNPTGDADFYQRQAGYLRGLEQYDPLSSIGGGAPSAAPAAPPPQAPPPEAPPPVPPQGLLDQNQGGPPEGLLAGGQQKQSGGFGNKLNAIGRLLSAASQGWMAGNQPGPNQGMQLGLAGQNVVGEGQNIQNEDYQRTRQEMLDRIAQQKADADTAAANKKGAGASQHILPPGAVLTDAEGKELFRNPQAEHEAKLSANAELVAKLSDPNLSPEERAHWQGLYEDQIRAPVGPTINIPGPVKQEFVKLADGGMGVFNPVTGQVTPSGVAPPAKTDQPRQLTAEELKQKGDAEKMAVAGGQIQSNLDRATELSPTAAAGPLAPYTKYFDYFTNPKRYNATQELDNVVLQNVLGSLRATFGSQPTEGERQVLKEVGGAISQPVEVRKQIFERAKQVAKESVETNQKKAADISSGAYGTTTPPGVPSAAPVRRKFNPATGKIE